MAEEYLQQVYDLQNQEDTDAYYSAWASTYDDELTSQGYATPTRCADALKQFVPLNTPILDIGCGTGLSGAAFRTAGFTDISGSDVNAEMLQIAEQAAIYRTTWVTDLTAPFPFEPGTYGAVAAVGVIGVGAAPITLLGEALDALAPGGHFVFSFNDHVLASPEFMQVLHDLIASGQADEMSAKHGPHITGLGSMSTVYVLRRH